MPRLFTALDIPSNVKNELSALAPIDRGVRLQNHPHITLRFIGNVSDAMASSICDALEDVEQNAYTQVLSGVGAFTRGNASHILWAGVTKCSGLLSLHSSISNSLVTLGHALEQREYTPHITIARLKKPNQEIVRSFISDHANFGASFDALSFGLFHLNIKRVKQYIQN